MIRKGKEMLSTSYSGDGAAAVVAFRCSEVTLDELMDCLFRGNLSRLTRSGEPSQEQLEAAWETLYEEFVRLTGGGKNSVFLLSRKVSYMEAKLRCAALAVLVGGGAGGEMLKAVGYAGGMERASDKMSRDMFTLSEATRELEEAKKGAKGEKELEQDFTRWVNAVSKYMGFRIDKKKVSVAEFVDMHAMMKQEQKNIKSK